MCFSGLCGVQEEPPDEENYTIPLTDDIRENLTQMQKTYDEIFEATYSPEQVGTVIKENPSSSTDLFNMTDIFIRRLIKFAKCIPEFKSLKQEDQIHLLKVSISGIFACVFYKDTVSMYHLRCSY